MINNTTSTEDGSAEGIDFAINNRNIWVIGNTVRTEGDNAEGIDFCMEVTPKTYADIKGGTLVRFRDRLTLLERAQEWGALSGGPSRYMTNVIFKRDAQ